MAQFAGDHLNAEQLGDLTALAEEHISADQIGNVAGMIQEQGANLDLGAIAEQAGLPGDVIGQISGLLGR
ncbi:chemotaxis protein [Bifidobacterium sp. SMA15]|uniref:Chemotaxis protein n=1 Tax=Bifidobacterium platyrrhinorum TaxID=2661628 RepID=A0A6L9SSA1_9BIFI|nr:chemotaxis protein [Bifidobacterium platyrrhinorum]